MPGSGGATLATDEVAGVHYELVKIVFGALETATLVSSGSPLPVDLRTNNLSGNLNVNVAASAVTQAVSGTVTANAGTGTFTVQESSSLVDDAAFSPASSRVLPVGFTFDNVSPDVVDEGDIGAARMSANRNIYVQLRDSAGNEKEVAYFDEHNSVINGLSSGGSVSNVLRSPNGRVVLIAQDDLNLVLYVDGQPVKALYGLAAHQLW